MIITREVQSSLSNSPHLGRTSQDALRETHLANVVQLLVAWGLEIIFCTYWKMHVQGLVRLWISITRLYNYFMVD